MDRSSRVIITGGAGLVGRAIARRLGAAGFTNIFPVTRTQCDLMDRKAVGDLFARLHPDYVFHAAACVYGILGNMQRQGQSFYENTLINAHVIDASLKVGVKKIAAMGTGAIYPYPPPFLPLREEDIFAGRPHPSESGYAHAKRGMLAMLEAYSAYNIDWTYIVSCNLFGPHDKFNTATGHVIPSLIAKFSHAKDHGGPVTVWGDGSAQRDFLYVDDAARAITTAMRGISGPVNIGSGLVWSISDVVETLSQISGVHEIAWDTTKPNGQEYRAYDLSKITAAGFYTRRPMDEALEKTWNWYRQ